MSKKPAERYKRRLEALNRRADFLLERVESKGLNNDSYDKQELSAIVWAINFIEEYPTEALNMINLNHQRSIDK